MNANAEKIATGLIALNGSQLVGRTRLQKTAYLLHRCGANLDLRFVYHYYGPYSFDLADGLSAAHRNKRIEVKEEMGRYGIPYNVFTPATGAEKPESLGELSADRARAALNEMDNVSHIVLELAATIVFLREEEGYDHDEAVKETKIRKHVKAEGGRIEKALDLLCELGLEIQAIPTHP